MTRITKKHILEQDGRPIPSEVLHMQRELYLRKLELKLNSQTLLLENVSESS
ncbi:hypothetical protein Avbf_05059 [Armadillidium vulgare]|nr:hypothetical protein Avbf_05059 [Armadillidium vulgare]